MGNGHQVGGVSTPPQPPSSQPQAAATAAECKVRGRWASWVFPRGPSPLCTSWGGGFQTPAAHPRGLVPRHVPRKRMQEGGDTEARCPRVSGRPTGWRGGEQKHLFGGTRNAAGSVSNLRGGLLGCFRNRMQSSWVLAKSILWLPKLYPALHGHPSLAADGWSSFPEE